MKTLWFFTFNFLLMLICSTFIVLITEKLFRKKFTKIRKLFFIILFSPTFLILHNLPLVPFLVLLIFQIILLKINSINSILNSLIIFIPYILIDFIFNVFNIYGFFL